MNVIDKESNNPVMVEWIEQGLLQLERLDQQGGVDWKWPCHSIWTSRLAKVVGRRPLSDKELSIGFDCCWHHRWHLSLVPLPEGHVRLL